MSFNGTATPVDYSSINPSGQVRVCCQRNPEARVAWLNRDWFEAEEHLLKPLTQNQTFTDWLQETFGVDTSIDGDLQTYSADRYGGTGGAPHGGSGRCINIGHFNSKGNGRTPLVAEHVPHSYSHGRLQFSQAIKQAIMSVVCNRVFPFGAVPVVAVLDLGLSYDFRQNGHPERCAAVIRPNFIRTAHLERSIFFGSSGFNGSDQYQDAKSVERHCNQILESASRPPTIEDPDPTIIVNEWVSRVCAQLGVGRSYRLWADYLVSSNICFDGAWCDLELFQNLPNFGRCYNQVNNVFGAEANSVLQTAKSIEFYLSKTAGKTSNRWASVSIEFIEQQIQSFFLNCSLTRLTPPGERLRNTHELRAAINSLYLFDQSVSYVEADLLEREQVFSPKQTKQRTQYEQRMARALNMALGRSDAALHESEQAVNAFLRPDPRYYGYRLRAKSEQLVRSVFLEQSTPFHDIQKFCDEAISAHSC